jgi:hypothetical protein
LKTEYDTKIEGLNGECSTQASILQFSSTTFGLIVQGMRNVPEQDVEILLSDSPPGLMPDVENTRPSAASSSIHRPSIPAPKSYGTSPRSDQSHESDATAEYPSRRPTNLYLDDGYEPTEQEGRKQVNRDILQVVKKLAPHSLEVYIRRFYPKSWAKRLAKMRDHGRQDRAWNPVDQNQVIGGSTATTSVGK